RRKPAVAGLLAALGLVLTVGFLTVTLLWLHAEGQRLAAETANADKERQRLEAEASAFQARKQRPQAEEQKLKAVQQTAEADRQRKLAEVYADKAFNAGDRMLGWIGHAQLKYTPYWEEQRKKILEEALKFYEGFLDQDDAAKPYMSFGVGRTHLFLAQLHA